MMSDVDMTPEFLARFGLSDEQIERDARDAEDEKKPDPLTGEVYYGLHLAKEEANPVTVSVRLPRATAARLTREARRYHISRSEYIRRRLA